MGATKVVGRPPTRVGHTPFYRSYNAPYAIKNPKKKKLMVHLPFCKLGISKYREGDLNSPSLKISEIV